MKKHIKYIILFLLLFTLNSYSLPLKKNEHTFLVISDIHLNTLYPHRMEINPSKQTVKNDLDQPMLEILISQIKNNIQKGVIPKPDFIIFLGDLAGHLRSSSHNTLNTESIVFRLLRNNFSPIPIFYTFGNNDSLEKDYGAFKDDGLPTQYKSPYEAAKFNSGWGDGFLSTGTICTLKKSNFPCIINENTERGYYSALIASHLRLISLNSILFSPKYIHGKDQSAMDELRWLQEQLNAAKKNQDYVLITMHIPVGNNVYDHSNFWIAQYQKIFLNTLKIYSPIIIGLLAAHTHQEELKIIKNTLNQTIAGVYYAPALSTAFGNSPAVKTFYFSQKNNHWALSNYETFHFLVKNKQLIFNKLYNYQSYYCTGQESSLLECLNNVTADKMKKYLSSGNQNFAGIMKSPQDMILVTP
jgi:sphingomyelin phosphodiesterase acid-like 3